MATLMKESRQTPQPEPGSSFFFEPKPGEGLFQACIRRERERSAQPGGEFDHGMKDESRCRSLAALYQLTLDADAFARCLMDWAVEPCWGENEPVPEYYKVGLTAADIYNISLDLGKLDSDVMWSLFRLMPDDQFPEFAKWRHSSEPYFTYRDGNKLFTLSFNGDLIAGGAVKRGDYHSLAKASRFGVVDIPPG